MFATKQIMNGSSETATLPAPPPPTPGQTNGGGVLFSLPSYHNHHHHYPSSAGHNGHYHLYHPRHPSTGEQQQQQPLIPLKKNGGGGSMVNDDIHVTVLQIDQNHQHHQSQQHHSQYLNGNPKYAQYHSYGGTNSINGTGGEVMNSVNHHHHNHHDDLNNDFITVLKIVSTGATILTTTSSTMSTATGSYSTTTTNTVNGTHNSNQRIFVDNKRGEIEEEVTIYRLPGERLGMALRFDGGQSANENIRRVFVQNITSNSPSSKAIGLMLGMLREGDEILQIDGRASNSLTRLECITLLRDAPVCIRLFVRRTQFSMTQNSPNMNSLDPSEPAVPNVSNNCCQMPLPTPTHLMPNGHHTEMQNHCLATNTTNNSSSSANTMLISPTNTPLLSQLINSSGESSMPPTPMTTTKKIPPPVPRRMATTTLSTATLKRKPRQMPMPGDMNNGLGEHQHQSFDMEPLPSSSSLIIMNNQLSEPLSIQQNGIEQHSLTSLPSIVIQSPVVVEKPPRRKNLHNGNITGAGNPPPLPPRRPKGPPPKPPTDRPIQSSSVVNVNLVMNSQESGSLVSKSLPSLVTVITSKSTSPTTTDTSVTSSQQSICSTTNLCPVTVCSTTTTSTPSLPQVANKTTANISNNQVNQSSKPTKVTFNISNSKVSSFIRHTAEKLHRKLSGNKATSSSFSNESSDEENTISSSNSSNGSTKSKSNTVLTHLDEKTIKEDSEDKEEELDANNVMLLNGKSDGPMKSSANLSNVHQSSSSSPMMASNSPTPAANYSDYSREEINEESFESDTDDTSSSVSTIIERGSFTNPLLSQFEHSLNQTKSMDIDQISLDLVDRVLSPFENRSSNNYYNYQNENQSSISSISSPSPSSPSVTSIVNNNSLDTYPNEKQLSSENKTLELIQIDDDQLKTKENKYGKESFVDAVESPNSIRNDTDFRRDQPQSIVNNEEINVAIEPDQSIRNEEFKQETNNLVTNQENGDDNDDEDLDAIKNDIFSRLEDDKDDFMIDTDYLNESSSRFMFHHNSSELILNSYSELSSITEEDEEEEASFEAKIFDSIDNELVPSKGLDMDEDNLNDSSCEAKLFKMNEEKPPSNEENVVNGHHHDNTNSSDDKLESPPQQQQPLLNGQESQTKVSLDNVFEFLNKAADDFEFVERMLELTNDKIDSIDDIMRIRESLRGLQESEQRENLQRFLDGKDVFEELIALSSPSSATSSSSMFSSSSSSASSHSSPSSPDNIEYPANMIKSSDSAIVIEKINGSTSSRGSDSPDQFTSLPVCFSDKPPMIPPKGQQQQPMINNNNNTNNKNNNNSNKFPNPQMLNQESKIPTLLPQKTPIVSAAKRSQSISNIFTRSNLMSGSFNSLVEPTTIKPSLIPRPISNFNLALPPKPIVSHQHSFREQRNFANNKNTSHNCLNRSTSMQSIFSTNSLSRSKPTSSKPIIPRRQLSSLTSSSLASSSSTSNYHHNCLKNQDSSLTSSHGLYYGSLSRTSSKSNQNVYNTGSLPRTSKTYTMKNPNTISNAVHYESSMPTDGQNRDFRTTSLTDLTYGGLVSLSSTNNNSIKTISQSSSLLTPSKTSSFHRGEHYYYYNNNTNNNNNPFKQHHYSISSGNLFRSDSLNLSSTSAATTSHNHQNNPFVQYHQHQQYNKNNNLDLSSSYSIYSSHSNSSGFSTLAPKQEQPPSATKQQLRTSSSLASLLPSSTSNNNINSHYWHCSNHHSHHQLTNRRLPNTTTNNNNNSGKQIRTNSLTQSSNNNQVNNICKVASKSRSKTDNISFLSNKLSDSEENNIVSIQQQHPPPIQSILRNSNSSNKANSKSSSNSVTIQQPQKDYWSQGKTCVSSNNQPQQQQKPLTSSSSSSSSSSSTHSDSDTSSVDDITISSNSSNNSSCYTNEDPYFKIDSLSSTTNKSKKEKSTSPHRVCFMDQIFVQEEEEKKKNNVVNSKQNNSQEEATILINGDLLLPNLQSEHNQQQQKLTKMDEPTATHQQHPYASSPEVAIGLSSSTSTSSISSLGSSVSSNGTPKSSSSSIITGSKNGKFSFVNNPHREDSGIFASDDNSTNSEFSQSPSPELIGRQAFEKIPEDQKSVEPNNQLIKKRISFLDEQQTNGQQHQQQPERDQASKTDQQQQIGKQMANNNGNNPQQIPLSLSRSSSAPCETIINEVTSILQKSNSQNASEEISPSNKKESNSFTLRDSFITARRHQNMCKLKGLIIPSETVNEDPEETTDSLASGNFSKLEIDLPTIISEDILKIQDIHQDKIDQTNGNKNLLVQENNETKSQNENHIQPPIEIIPLKPANVNVPKYSPMFKRRSLSVPSNSYQTSAAPTILPKPRIARMSKPPPLPPKNKEVNDTQAEDSLLSLDNKESSISETNIKLEEPKKNMNDFVIYQRQHSMRAIIYDFNDLDLKDDKEYLAYLGLTIKGGFDSDTDFVTVENIDPNGLAAQDGRLHKSDRIISINGKRLAGMTHNKILDLLKTSCLSGKVTLVSTRPHDSTNNSQEDSESILTSSNVSSLKEVGDDDLSMSSQSNNNFDANNNNFRLIQANITKDVTGLGFIIQGGKNSGFGDRPISIKRIFRGGPVDKEGTLLEGDELIFVNDHPVEGMTREEAWNFLKQIPDGKVSLVVRRRKHR